MADVFEKAEKFAKEVPKQEVIVKSVKDFFPLKSMTKAHYLMYVMVKKLGKKTKNKMHSVSVFSQVLHYLQFSVWTTNFHFWHSQ